MQAGDHGTLLHRRMFQQHVFHLEGAGYGSQPS